ncbi:hypothetical protein [Winogradskyella flava]|uniref:hypothetical protein n=1 Tax=Winogradskyella flava TaxID=1884876 RepID=UPI0024907A6C|nr:hypothetical protein [Winogradskyella flava]
MKLPQPITKVFCLIFFFLTIACKDKVPKPNPALAGIDLKRGELLLCGTEQFGDVSFSLDCNYEIRETFDLAISLLHSFEYAEAEKAFVKVIDTDPECAMAYWGVAMSIYHSLWAPPGPKELEKGLRLIEIAQTLPSSKIAKQYIEAIGLFYQNWDEKDHHTGELLYESKMAELYLNDKSDTEAAIFYALAIRSAADPNDQTYAKQKKSGKILEALFLEQPNHPGIAHYIIHNYDYPELAHMALEIARRYAEIAPASAHAQHMPSHIFTRLGLWQESIDTNINSASSAVCYAKSAGENASWAQEIHAVDYLVYAYLQQGDNQNAQVQLEDMENVTDVFPQNDLAATYALTAIPVRMALENKDWNKAANLQLPKINFDWEKLYWEKAMLHFGKALGYSNIENIKAAENELQILQTLHQKLVDDSETYKAGQVNIQVHTAKAWVELAKENNDQALKLMKIAVELESKTSKHPITPGEVLPADELLGDMLLALNRPEEALMAYEVSLKGHPNRFNAIYGAAIAAKRTNKNNTKVLLYFNQLIELAKGKNSNRPEIQEARLYISEEQTI